MQVDTTQICSIKIRVENGILIYSCQEKVNIDLPMAMEMVRLRREFVKDKAFPVIIPLKNIVGVNKEARAYLSKGDAIDKLTAVAFISDSILHKIMFNIFITFNSPKAPIRLFSDLNSGLTWLSEFVDE